MPLKLPIYLDYHASTPVDPRALEAMLPYFTEHFGNAASRTHAYGWKADDAVEAARRQVAALIGASAKEIVFTSGATESNNLAIKGVACALRSKGNHIITVATEHKAVLDSCRHLQKDGFEVTCLPVTSDGLVDPDVLSGAITDRTILISVMAANNEIGVLQPVREIAAIARERGVIFHCDAVQAIGKVPFSVADIGVDLVSMTAHKMYGPKGVGALYVRRQDRKIELEPLIDGGGHERGLRSGTLNVPGIVGFGKAAEIARAEMPAESERLRTLRDRLLEKLRARVPDLHVNGSMVHRLPHNLHVSFPHVAGEALLVGIGDICVSAGSACSSGSEEPPYVLTALGLDPDLARASIRFGLGRYTTGEEIDYAADKVADVVQQLRRAHQA
ncbi:MAG TPA: IscS subfamily cysteine desulfurase [Vicinamibacterales bacterium]